MPRCCPPPRVSHVSVAVGIICRKRVPRSVVKLSRRQIRRRIKRRQLPEARSVGKLPRRQIRRRQLHDAPAAAPAVPARRMKPVTLVATSSGEPVRVLVEVAVVSVELSAHDDAVRGVVALSFAVLRAVGVRLASPAVALAIPRSPLFLPPRSTRPTPDATRACLVSSVSSPYRPMRSSPLAALLSKSVGAVGPPSLAICRACRRTLTSSATTFCLLYTSDAADE